MGNLTIGLVNLPQVRQLLTDSGFDVVSGDTFAEAVGAVRNHVRTKSMDIVLLVGDSEEAPQQAAAWLRGIAARVPAVVVNLSGAIGLGQVPGLRSVIDTPAVWSEVVKAITGSGEGAAAATVQPDGRVHVEAAASGPDPVPDVAADDPFADDPWAVDDFGADLDPPAAAAVDPVTVVPSLGEEEDPWASEEVTGGAAAPVYTGPEPAADPTPGVEVPQAGALEVEEGDDPDDDDDDELEDFDFDTDTPSAAPQPEPAPVPEPQPERVVPRPEVTDPAPWPGERPTIPGPIPQPLPAQESAPLPAGYTDPAVTAGFGEQEPAAAPAPVVPPPPAPAPVVQHAPSTRDDILDMLQPTDRSTHHGPHGDPQGRLGHVIICTARNGGVSKSTTSTVLAQYAGDHGPDGWRVALVDYNIGQADVRGYLSLGRAPIPTIVDAGRTGGATDVLVPPPTLNTYRKGRPPLSFALVAGTPSTITREEVELVTPTLMRDVIADLRTRADLVVIDTETIDEPDQTGYWEGVFLPLIREGAWLLMISSSSTESVRNMRDWLTHRQQEGQLTRDRVMLMFNRVPDGSIDAINEIAARMSNLGHHIGTMAEDEEIDYTQKAGEVPSEVDTYAPVAAAILRHVTGRPEFDPDMYDTKSEGLLSRLFRRGGKR